MPDGDYQLEILSGALSANGVNLDGDGDGTQGGIFQFGVHRLYGDVSGNRTVDTQDGFLFRAGFNTSVGEAGYVAGLDYNGDGTIDAFERVFFEENFRTSLDSVVTELSVVEESSTSTVRDTAVAPVSVRFWDPAGLFRSGDRLFNSGRTNPAPTILSVSIQGTMPEDPLWESIFDHEEEEWLF